MTHPITDLQSALIGAWRADAVLSRLLGGAHIFDAPPKGLAPPYVCIARHDAQSRDADMTPGHEHRLTLHCWHPTPSREKLLELVERLVAGALGAEAASAGLAITHALHERTETAIDMESGMARAALFLRFFTEPNQGDFQ